MNDTIVIFDRIRENNRLLRKESFADVVNKSINQTLSRTILTSGLTFLTVLVLFLMGPGASCFLLCPGGRDCGRNILQFWYRCSARVAWNRGRGQGVAAGTGPSRQQTRGSENVPDVLLPLEEVASMFEEMVISSPNRRRPASPGRSSYRCI